jgi:hypothetical protein
MLGSPGIAWSPSVFLARSPALRQLIVSVLLATFLATVPLDMVSLPTVVASDACSTGDDVRATTCRLVDGVPAEGTLGETSTQATYRLDVFAPDASLDLVLAGQDGSARAAVLNWRGETVGEAVLGEGAAETRLHATLALPGAYAVRVSSDAPAGNWPYRLTATVGYPGAAAQPVWPAALAANDGPVTGERQLLRTPRGGTPAGGVAVARALRAPPEGEVGDFTLVADVQFEQILGPSALTVRFRYEPEAGGGTGYVLSINPFGGTATLDSFDEGQRKPVVAHAQLPVELTGERARRLVLQANGPSIRVSLDGQAVLEATDARYPRGLIAVGTVTWSDPVAVTFDHLQVSVPR